MVWSMAETSDMTSEGLGEMFEGDSADTCAKKILVVLMGGRAEGLACADPGARTSINASGILECSRSILHLLILIPWPLIFSL